MRTRRAWPLAVAALLLSGCSMTSQGTPHATLSAALAFAAYPRGTVQEEMISPDAFGPFSTPGHAGMRIYQTDDDAETVRSYYAALGQKNGWAVDAGEPHEGLQVRLDRAPIHLHVGMGSSDGTASPLQFILDVSVDP